MKLKNTLLLGILCAMSSQSFGVFITMPSAAILNQRLNAIGACHFAAMTNIAQQLGGQQIRSVIGVATEIDRAMDYYMGTYKHLIDIEQTKMLFPEILKAFFQDSPDALAELESLTPYGICNKP